MMALRISIVLAAILVFIGPGLCEMDLTVQYYTSVSLTCDSPALNVSTNMADVDRMYWILNDGMLVDSDSKLPKTITMSANGYRLNITEVKDETFGYYHCIVMYNDKTLKSVRKGVNVDGPDFSELHEKYRHSAMIGGIAAAVMLVVIGAGCLIWHFRFKGDDDDNEDDYKGTNVNSNSCEGAYENNAMEMEDKIAPQGNMANGTFDEKL